MALKHKAVVTNLAACILSTKCLFMIVVGTRRIYSEYFRLPTSIDVQIQQPLMSQAKTKLQEILK
jgi:hypothetical protein